MPAYQKDVLVEYQDESGEAVNGDGYIAKNGEVSRGLMTVRAGDIYWSPVMGTPHRVTEILETEKDRVIVVKNDPLTTNSPATRRELRLSHTARTVISAAISCMAQCMASEKMDYELTISDDLDHLHLVIEFYNDHRPVAAQLENLESVISAMYRMLHLPVPLISYKFRG